MITLTQLAFKSAPASIATGVVLYCLIYLYILHYNDSMLGVAMTVLPIVICVDLIMAAYVLYLQENEKDKGYNECVLKEVFGKEIKEDESEEDESEVDEEDEAKVVEEDVEEVVEEVVEESEEEVSIGED